MRHCSIAGIAGTIFTEEEILLSRHMEAQPTDPYLKATTIVLLSFFFATMARDL